MSSFEAMVVMGAMESVEFAEQGLSAMGSVSNCRERTREASFSLPGVKSVWRKIPSARLGWPVAVMGFLLRHGVVYSKGWEMRCKR